MSADTQFETVSTEQIVVESSMRVDVKGRQSGLTHQFLFIRFSTFRTNNILFRTDNINISWKHWCDRRKEDAAVNPDRIKINNKIVYSVRWYRQ